MEITEKILASNKVWLENKINKLNKRCKKLGILPLILTFSEDIVEEKWDENRLHCRVTVYTEATIIGDDPKIDGWELISVFQVEGNLVLSRTLPGKELPYEPKTVKCEHCGHNRHRKSSILLQNTETGEYKEVGTSCVMDFIGYDPKSWLFWSTIETSILSGRDEESGWNERSEYHEELLSFLAITAKMVEMFGWVSKGKAYEDESLTSTVSNVFEQIDIRDFPHQHKNQVFHMPSQENFEFASSAIEHFKNSDEDSEYVTNIKKVIELGYVPKNMAGLAASIVGTYYVIKQRENANEAEKKASLNEYFGDIKKRYDLELTWMYSSHFEGYYGLTYIHNFVDAEGRAFKWFTGNDESFEKDEILKVRGTVKKHEEYKGRKSTVLTRCSIEFPETVED